MRAGKGWLVAVSIAAVLVTMVAGGAPADGPGAKNIEPVAGVQFSNATHLEFLRREVDGVERVYAVVGSRWRDDVPENGSWTAPGGGVNIIDITEPEAPVFVANVPCRTDNVDVAVVYVDVTVPLVLEPSGAVLENQAYDTLIAIGSNDAAVGCTVEYPKAGGGVEKVRGNSVSFAGIRAGARLEPGEGAVDFLGSVPRKDWPNKIAHTVVAHPTRPVVYAGNQNLPDRNASIEILDVSAWPPKLTSVRIPQAGVGPHDITFNPEGDRAYASSIDESFIFDVSGDKLFAPALVGAITAPGLKIHHEANLHPNKRHVLVVDEFVATSSNGQVTATNQCPGGGVHVFDLGDPSELSPRGALEPTPPQVGVFFADDRSLLAAERLSPDNPRDALGVSCTAHEFTMSADGSWMPIGWFGAGIRVFDLTDLQRAATVAVPTPVTVAEIGHYREPRINIWAAKVIAEHDRYIFATDETTGFRVFRYTGDLPTS